MFHVEPHLVSFAFSHAADFKHLRTGFFNLISVLSPRDGCRCDCKYEFENGELLVAVYFKIGISCATWNNFKADCKSGCIFSSTWKIC